MTHTQLLRLILTLLFCAVIAACSSGADSPEAQVNATIDLMETAIEERNTSDLFMHISDAYQDHKGNNKEALRKFVRFYFLRNKNIELFTNIKSLEFINATTAAVEATVIMSAQTDARGSDLLSQLRADSQAISAVFRKENDAWRLTSMSWPNQIKY